MYAEFTGTVSDGKIRLSSTPPLSQDQILSLLLFGSPEGSVGSSTSSGSEAATAVAAAGSTAAKGINQAISDITSLDLKARVDTSTGSARPEVVLRLSPRVDARITRALGPPAPGEAPDRTFLTIDLRIGARWALSTIVGDHGGTAFELVWRLRF